MKRLTLAFISALIFFDCSLTFGQNNENRILSTKYAKEANRLDLQNDPDSITLAYVLHCKVLELDKFYPPSYRSKISVEYKREKYNDALNSAIAFVTNLPTFGDSWVYLGLVQSKLNDTVGATNSFNRALHIYEDQLKKIKDKNWKDQLKWQIEVVEQLLNDGEKGILAEVKSGDDFVEKFMTYHGVQFF